VDIISLLLQTGAKVDALTKDQYTGLHIAAKEGQEDVIAIKKLIREIALNQSRVIFKGCSSFNGS